MVFARTFRGGEALQCFWQDACRTRPCIGNAFVSILGDRFCTYFLIWRLRHSWGIIGFWWESARNVAAPEYVRLLILFSCYAHLFTVCMFENPIQSTPMSCSADRNILKARHKMCWFRLLCNLFLDSFLVRMGIYWLVFSLRTHWSIWIRFFKNCCRVPHYELCTFVRCDMYCYFLAEKCVQCLLSPPP